MVTLVIHLPLFVLSMNLKGDQFLHMAFQHNMYFCLQHSLQLQRVLNHSNGYFIHSVVDNLIHQQFL